MLTRKKIPLFIGIIFCLEALIYLWAFLTTESEFIFDKCARNSGRASSAIFLLTLIMVGYYGLKNIYLDEKKKDTFRILLTLFTINHLIHFLFVFLNFKSHELILNIGENMHGFITFIFIVLMPIILWMTKKLNLVLYILIILHLFNVSYFIMETFYSTIKPEYPAYHNQFGILVFILALIYILYRVFRENKRDSHSF